MNAEVAYPGLGQARVQNIASEQKALKCEAKPEAKSLFEYRLGWYIPFRLGRWTDKKYVLLFLSLSEVYIFNFSVKLQINTFLETFSHNTHHTLYVICSSWFITISIYLFISYINYNYKRNTKIVNLHMSFILNKKCLLYKVTKLY